MVDDGTPLSFPAIIERVCNGNPRAEGYTDSKGYFSLTLGQSSEVIADASEIQTTSSRNTPPYPSSTTPITPTGDIGGNGGTDRNLGMDARYSSCELRAKLGGYTSQTLNLTGRTPLDNPDLGTILLHRLGAPETATMVTATTLKAPKEARKALQKGLDLAKKNKPEEAIAGLREAVGRIPILRSPGASWANCR